MKIIFRFIIVALSFIAVEKLIRTQTDGFRAEKTLADFPYVEKWEVQNKKLDPEILSQPYYFLGSGVQCYAFLSQDGKTVLKIFKHYHMWPRSTLLRKLPFEKIVNKRKKRMEHIFESALISYQELQDQTRVFHLNINETEGLYPKITIYDKIGVKQTLNLNKTPFALQKKAEEILPYMENNPQSAKMIIDSLVECIEKRSKLGIVNTDPIIWRNFGICEGRAIEIDIGSFSRNSYMKNMREEKKELFFETLELKNWLHEHQPNLEKYLNEKIHT